ncbi:glycoside hydrolase family protein [Nanobdella aerobiophila]|uniref:Glycoside hydrolase family protein n=1 Tax=Nanobdella aerobiophila TaxID=2586965 RepID=A0A915WSP9_9ARCH|nr:hypothetical protein [Nanobdella aerobiophila]BBL45550.1 glycoside hydrolase family protein [Nanobdella aerobiophila]
MSTFILDSLNYSKNVFKNFNEYNYYLDVIQIGMEFNDINGTVNLGYKLYNWNFIFQ